MAQIAIQGKKYYPADDGTPLSGGKVYFYEAGSDPETPKDTYTSSAADTPNSNPVILDAAGRATIFFGSGSYKEVVTDSEDNLISTVDGISATGEGNTVEVKTFSELRALTEGVSNLVIVSGGSSEGDGAGGVFRWDTTNTDADDGGITIRPSTNPASGRWVRNIEQGFVNSDWYVPTGNGIADDTSKFTNAYTYAYNNDLYVLIPDGTFLWTTVPTNSDNVWTVFTPKAILKWSGIQPELKVHIYDKEQHFDISSGNSEAPILGGIDKVFPEWFGETLSSHDIATETVLENQGVGYPSTSLSYTDILQADTDNNDVIITAKDSDGDDQATISITDDFTVETNTGKIILDPATTVELTEPLILQDDDTIGCVTDTNLLTIGDRVLTVSGTILGTFIGSTADNDLIGLAENLLIVNGGLRVNDSGNVGCYSDADLMTLASSLLTINGSLKLDDSANIGCDSDTNLIQLTPDDLVINGDISPSGDVDGGGSINATTSVSAGTTIDATTDLTAGGNLKIGDNCYLGNASNTDLIQLLTTGNIAITPTSLLSIFSAVSMAGYNLTASNLIASVDVSVGGGINITEGANKTSGVATLVAGTITVSTTVVTANSRIHLTIQALGTVVVPKAIAVTARTVGQDFTITSADGTDTSTIAWLIIEPTT